jgi:UDP-N-acetylglucosamine enolpyruvyl transferase
MSEYLQQLGRRQELREKLIGLKINADSHRESLRLALDPTVDVSELAAEKILVLAAALAEGLTDIQEVEARIEAVDKIIGK